MTHHSMNHHFTVIATRKVRLGAGLKVTRSLVVYFSIVSMFVRAVLTVSLCVGFQVRSWFGSLLMRPRQINGVSGRRLVSACPLFLGFVASGVLVATANGRFASLLFHCAGDLL